MTRQRRSVIVGIVTLTLGAVAPARAEDELSAEDREFEARLVQAVEHYEAQRFEQAIDIFQRAYDMRPQPELIYNIARIYERSLQLQEATENYERFLSLPNTTADLRSRAANSLAAIRAEIAARERAQRAGQDTGTEGGENGTGQGTGEQGTGEPPEPLPRDRAPRGVIVGWALVGVGTAALAVGIVMGGLALAEQTATEEAGNLADQDLHLNRGENYALSADVLFGAGGAMAVAGMILLIISSVRSGGEEDEDVSLTPFFRANGGLGLTFGGRF